jgi:RNA polymerase sigma factor (sigma-70 family)
MMDRLVDHLRSAVRAGGADLTDGQLLTCFVEQRDEAAFEALLRRHGPMVLGVCRRVLRSHQDAEDAFQATFLVLIRKAASVRSRETVANWLYGVAYNAARKARAVAARRQAREKQMTQVPEPDVEPPGMLGCDVQALLDKELSGLPQRYRLPLVLCELEGKTHKEAAQLLGLPAGTLSSRLARGKATLARRLSRRGVIVSAAAVAAALSGNATAGSLPVSLVTSTVKAARLVVGQAGLTGAASANVVALTRGVLQAMLLSKLRFITVVVLAAGLVCAGAAVSVGAWGRVQTAQQAGRSSPDPSERPNRPPEGEARPADPPAPGGASGESRVRALLKERLATLQEVLAETEKASRAAAVSPNVVLQAKLQVLKAELDLCESDKERVAVHEKMVAVARECERMIEQQYRAAMATHTDLLKAKASRLEAEIALERARTQAAAPSR